MKRKALHDVAASVRQRLLNHAKARGEDYNFTLTQYVIERFLYRLAESDHNRRFVLKGATLFCLWSREPHRATWDVDLLRKGGGTIPQMEKAETLWLRRNRPLQSFGFADLALGSRTGSRTAALVFQRRR
jgi:hypothetical protein